MNTLLALLEKVDKPFLLCVGCSGVNSLLLWHGKLNEGNYTMIIMGTVAAYIGGWLTGRIKGTPAERAVSP